MECPNCNKECERVLTCPDCGAEGCEDIDCLFAAGSNVPCLNCELGDES